MKKKFIHAGKVEIVLSILLISAAIILFRCCTSNKDIVYADTEDLKQTTEMIHYQQSQGRFAVEENGYVNIRK